jgi:hypothetical protein
MTMAEINVYGSSSIESSNQTKYTLYITLQDSGNTQTGKMTEDNITARITHYINYTLANNITLLSCLYKSQHTINNYDANGNVANTTTDIEIVPYNYSAESLRYYGMRDQDILQLELDCFYDSAVDDTIFQYLSESVVGLSISADSYTCDSCSRGNFEETINDYIEAQQTTEDQIDIYGNIAGVTDKVTDLWLVIYWVLRIFLFLLLVGLVFAVGFWIHGMISRLSKK